MSCNLDDDERIEPPTHEGQAAGAFACVLARVCRRAAGSAADLSRQAVSEIEEDQDELVGEGQRAVS